MIATAAEVLDGIDLSGRTALVTGGYSGIGIEMVRALAGAGASVLVPARRPDRARAAVEGMARVEVGELDLACTDLLDSDGHEDDATIVDVTVDMADLEFIDTAGVRALIEVKSRHSDKGRTVHLVNSVRLVRKVVSLYGRSDLLAG